MLEASARRALDRLGYKMRRIEGLGYQIVKDEQSWMCAEPEDVEAFIVNARRSQLERLALAGKEAQVVEVESRGFTKVVTAKPVRFQCAGCGQWFEQERFPSRRAAQGLLYHSEECRKEAERKKTRERVARYRAGKQPKID